MTAGESAVASHPCMQQDRLATHDVRLCIVEHDTQHLSEYEARQNGHLARMAVKVDEFPDKIEAMRADLSKQADTVRNELGSKIDRLLYSVGGLLITVLGALIVYLVTHPGQLP